ncbi:aminoglycoside phosphotransferase family protein [Nocardiopsis lambiniae]|uniref:Aminoglycoside phosphotransferase family protein n=1 Tax=Nocardiopsis lambiniae TaxID=3075539 RepID=A0ABU2M706_9ACTN|nr:aminoglycoside phosphotransferase family protein [Nocardiopsis sp. DSM 44743]MDT0328374.1 aminoglycoside phosphotransferase family protein [Nocardiopsis sp. DSM 44743]
MRMHTDQLTVDTETAARLIADRFPHWADLPLAPVLPGGTVNAVFHLGDHLIARFPLLPTDPETALSALKEEDEAARELLGRTRFPTPEPVALGEPGEGYPMPWSVQTRLHGTPADRIDPGDGVDFALDLAEFVRDVRSIDTRGRVFAGTGRGGRVADHDAWVRTCLERSEGMLDVPRLRRLWEERLRDLPRGDAPDVMNHGDLMPGNLLVRDGRLVGVVDVGGLGPADPALDLLCAWDVLEERPRRVFRDALGVDDPEWERGRAWAFEQALGLVRYYRDTNPPMSRIGRRTLRRVLDDQG